jgi:hypothetical protein
MKVSMSRRQLGWLVAITIASLGCKMRGNNSELQTYGSTDNSPTAIVYGETVGFLFDQKPCSATWIATRNKSDVKQNREETTVYCKTSKKLSENGIQSENDVSCELKIPGIIKTPTNLRDSVSVKENRNLEINCTRLSKITTGEYAPLQLETTYHPTTTLNRSMSWDWSSDKLNIKSVNSILEYLSNEKFYVFFSEEFKKPRIKGEINGSCSVKSEFSGEVVILCNRKDNGSCYNFFSIHRESNKDQLTVGHTFRSIDSVLSKDWQRVNLVDFMTDDTVVDYLKKDCKDLFVD